MKSRPPFFALDRKNRSRFRANLIDLHIMKRIAFFFLVLASAAFAGRVRAQSTDSLKVSILGDSYSTFEGWLQPAWNAVWYFNKKNPMNDVDKVEQTWWYQVADGMGYKLERNNSFSGATICYSGYKGSDGLPSDYSDRSFIGRAADLGHPDIILVCGGTNDSWSGAPVGEYLWKDWTNEDLYCFRPAMAKMCSELKTLYPASRTVFILNSELREDINESVHSICSHFGIECVDLHDIEKQAGHPSQAGMKAIAVQVIERLKK